MPLDRDADRVVDHDGVQGPGPDFSLRKWNRLADHADELLAGEDVIVRDTDVVALPGHKIDLGRHWQDSRKARDRMPRFY